MVLPSCAVNKISTLIYQDKIVYKLYVFGNNHNVAMTASFIPTNYDHNKYFTDVSTTILWPSSVNTLSKSLRLYAK